MASRKILATEIYNFENLQNVNNRTQSENDVTKNWCIPHFSQETKFNGKSISKIH
jgi:hypothetical protein